MGTKRTNEQAEDMAIGTVIFVPDDPDIFMYKSDDDTWGVYFRERSEYLSDYDVNASLNPEHIIVGTTSIPPVIAKVTVEQEGKMEVAVTDGLDRLLAQVSRAQSSGCSVGDTSRWIYAMLLELKSLKKRVEVAERHRHHYKAPGDPNDAGRPLPYATNPPYDPGQVKAQ